MSFTSLNYFVFICLVYLLYILFSKKQQKFLLLLASFFFYAAWDIRFLFLVIFSAAINYSCAIIIESGSINRRLRYNLSTFVVFSFLICITIQWQSKIINLDNVLQGNIIRGLINLADGYDSLVFFSAAVCLLNLVYIKLNTLSVERKKGIYLVFCISINLLILGIFKYYGFFIENLISLLDLINIDASRYYTRLILPIGISFYTFRGIGYVVDVYRGTTLAEKDYFNFTVFIAFFPSLLAGPIDRAKDLIPQIAKPRSLTLDKTLEGIHLIIYGLFKKVVIADSLVRTVNSVYLSSGQPNWIDVIIATFSFTIQIYCDFSGYTDIARGTAKLFGIDLMVNFDSPYFSKNPQEFWARWHISLSTWLRDYLYISLGGNRNGPKITYRNVLITMALGGLWHGAAWNFVIWGIYHGILLCIYRIIGIGRASAQSSEGLLTKAFKFLIFFTLICYGWLLFKSESFEKIYNLTSILLFDFGNLTFAASKPRAAALFGLPIFLFVEIVEYIGKGKFFYQMIPVQAWSGIYAVVIFSLIIGMSTESTQFIYFNF